MKKLLGLPVQDLTFIALHTLLYNLQLAIMKYSCNEQQYNERLASYRVIIEHEQPTKYNLLSIHPTQVESYFRFLCNC